MQWFEQNHYTGFLLSSLVKPLLQNSPTIKTGSQIPLKPPGSIQTMGYMGYVDGKYMLFADETDYEEYLASNHTKLSLSWFSLCPIRLINT